MDEAIFTAGGKLALFNTLQILVDHGDEVILPVPYWVSFKDIIQYAGGKVVFLETSEAESFRITADAIEKAITPKTKAIILNSPSNPAGSVVQAEDLERIVHLAHDRGIYLLLDECYVYLNYAGKPVSGGSFTWAKEHIVVLGSLSKTYAMTGWRAGYALAAKPVVANLSKLQSQSTSNATSFVQKAAIAALWQARRSAYASFARSLSSCGTTCWPSCWRFRALPAPSRRGRSTFIPTFRRTLARAASRRLPSWRRGCCTRRTW